jgi:hypothetical protein
VDLQAGVRRERSLDRSPQVLLRCVFRGSGVGQ